MQNRILLHACCGVCSGYPIVLLRELGYEPLVFFFNPNIYPAQEYSKRLDAQREICKALDCEIIEETYEHESFLSVASGLESEPERGLRCDRCFELRLKASAEKAKELGIDSFTTSIVISPHKNYAKISEQGMKIASDYGIKYLAQDFKKKDGFLKTNKLSKEFNIYRQGYCGCEFSIPV